MLFTAGILVSFIAAAQAGCDNACSGHGSCQLDGVCDCFDNWGLGLSHDSGDCSDRVCPFEIAWIDTPDENGDRHKYAECAGRGLCNRETGDCECFPGYEGKACKRTACPNDCSGHGQCAYMDDLPYQTTPFDWFNNMYVPHDISVTADYNAIQAEADFLTQSPKTFSGAYYGWDSMKTRGCVCDPEWGDVDCSKRMCDYGTDIMDHRPDMSDTQLYHKQQIQFRLNTANSAQDGNTFALTFKSKLNETFTTIPIVFNYMSTTTGMTDEWGDFNLDIQAALEGLPNRVIDSVNVETESRVYSAGTVPAACSGVLCAAGTVITITVEFVGDHVQGAQNLLTVRNYKCDDGCTPKLSGLELVPGSTTVATLHTDNTINTDHYEFADYNSYECGRRGKCNYDTGVCQCFAGYTGLACNTITALV
jgi:hypothetical protein